MAGVEVWSLMTLKWTVPPLPTTDEAGVEPFQFRMELPTVALVPPPLAPLTVRMKCQSTWPGLRETLPQSSGSPTSNSLVVAID
ncbi:MAG TPA: hypothetical protein VIT01_02255 [Acidimicrobiales bacterium]